MSFESDVSRIDYIGNGVATVFTYPFKIFNAGDLQVVTRSQGLETMLTLGVDYVVSGVGLRLGGNITLIAPLASGSYMAIRRVRPIVQRTDLRNQGDYYPEIVEDSLDHIIMIEQQQQDEIDRSIRLPVTVSPLDFSNQLPSTIAGVANSVLMTNPLGNGWALGPDASQIASAQTYANQINANISAAQALMDNKILVAEGVLDGKIASATTQANNAATSANNAATSLTTLTSYYAPLDARVVTLEGSNTYQGQRITPISVGPTSINSASDFKETPLFTVPAGYMLEWVLLKLDINFDQAIEMSIGLVGDIEAVMTSMPVNAGAGPQSFKIAQYGAPFDFSQPTDIKLFTKSSGANIVTNNGFATIYAQIRKVI